MNNLKNRYSGTKIWNRRTCFTILNSLFLIFLCSGQAFAGCLTASITATTPSADFVVNGNGTVTHKKTGLMWKQCSEGLSGSTCATGTASTFTWQNALKQAGVVNAGAGFAGFTDWRLPNITELESIVERQCTNPSINAAIFPATATTTGRGYWSASPYATYGKEAWLVNFNLGHGDFDSKTFAYGVRLVRGGQ